jgi:L-ascorbate metabolism protein UlaG (beta-lactamase superfamily)
MAIRNPLPLLCAAGISALLAACAPPLAAAPSATAAAPAPVPAAAGMPARAGKVRVQWLGQSTTKITTADGKVIVIDPWVTSNPKTPDAYKKLEALGKVDLVLVTHGHFDHFADAPALAKLNNAPLYGPAGLIQSVTTLGIMPAAQAIGFNKSGTVTPLGAGIAISAVHAEHSSELAYKNPDNGKNEVHVGGEPIGYIIDLGGMRIYHTGDTGVFGDMKWIADYYKPDLVLMPIGGHYVMGPKDAAYATRELLHPKYVIPIHYGTTPLLKGTPEEYVAALGSSSTAVIRMQPGEMVEF